MQSAHSPRSRAAGLLPGLGALRHYQRAWLRADLAAGLTVGAMLVPQSMAYAELAGLPPEFGFYAVIGALVVYALVGTSRHLGVGPEPGTAILAAAGVSSIAAGDPTRYIALKLHVPLRHRRGRDRAHRPPVRSLRQRKIGCLTSLPDPTWSFRPALPEHLGLLPHFVKVMERSPPSHGEASIQQGDMDGVGIRVTSELAWITAEVDSR